MFLGATSLSATDKQAFSYTVQVCAGPTLGHPALPRAQTITAGMFAGIGIRVEWIDVRACPPGAIHISISSPTPRIEAPGMLAYALPYEGTHVVICYDRVEQTVERPKVPALLAHVDGARGDAYPGRFKSSFGGRPDEGLAFAKVSRANLSGINFDRANLGESI